MAETIKVSRDAKESVELNFGEIKELKKWFEYCAWSGRKIDNELESKVCHGVFYINMLIIYSWLLILTIVVSTASNH